MSLDIHKYKFIYDIVDEKLEDKLASRMWMLVDYI